MDEAIAVGEPITLNRDGYTIQDGHTRYQVLRDLGYSDSEIRQHFATPAPKDGSLWPPPGTH